MVRAETFRICLQGIDGNLIALAMFSKNPKTTKLAQGTSKSSESVYELKRMYN